MSLVANSVLALVSLALAIRLGMRYAARRMPSNLWFAVGFFCSAWASFSDLISHAFGAAPAFWYASYWIAASSLVGFLGVGSAYLAHRRFGPTYLGLTALLAIWVTAAVLMTLGGQNGSMALSPDLFTLAPNAAIKLPFALQSGLGGTVIFVGALWSWWRFRLAATLWVAIGAAVFSSGGTVAGWLGNQFGIFYWTQVAGILLLWLGVERSLARATRAEIGRRTAS